MDSILKCRLEQEPNSTLAERQINETWQPVTVAEFNQEVIAIAKGLVALGITPGQTVGIMSRTRYEWTLFDFAIWAAGAVTVPIYETSSQEQVEWILENSGASVVVVETDKNAELVAAAAANLTDRAANQTRTLTIEPATARQNAAAQAKAQPAVAYLTELGAQVADAEIERRRNLANSDTLATIIYTSGTTGRPKGVELTHGGFLSLALNTVAHVPEVFNAGGRVILFLPLAHVFARFVQVVAIAGGSVLGHSPDIKDLTRDLKAFRPTYLLGVPRIFEKVYNGAEQSSAAEKALPYFHWAARVAIAYSRALDTPKGPSAWLRFQRVFADGLVYSKLRDKLGGKVKFAVSGGGPLGERLGHFYRGLGLNIIEGYGLTETTAPTSVNRPGATRIGSVGKMLPGTSAAIADDGEILLRGPHIFRGYHRDAEATAAAFTPDGWFRTGDLGKLDDDGYLHITGRKKEIIVTAAGKNVAPAVLEDRVRSHPLISQCVVVGDNRPFIGALLTLDAEGLSGWLTMKGKPELTAAEALADPDVLASIEKAVNRANEAVSRAESIRKWELIPGDLTIENGYLTPSMKVKRHEVLADFAGEIEQLYTDTRELPQVGKSTDNRTPGQKSAVSQSTSKYAPVA
ncbi:MAG: AMP-dependent synthetase/ligase [Promicromonosporaceae bacterium]|nr:AMP-dependent synthetase/ligase [Promicromonosporaceae bacterium]